MKGFITIFTLLSFLAIPAAFAEESTEIRVPETGETLMAYDLPCGIAESACSKEKLGSKTVKLSAFFMDRDEVSVADVKACIRDGKCKSEQYGLLNQLPDTHAAPMGYDAAVAYCKAQGKRLPKAVEWLAASTSAEAVSNYSWGDNYEGSAHAKQLGKIGEFPRDLTSRGFRDMSGNALEWVEGELMGKYTEDGTVACIDKRTRPCMGKAPYALYERFGCIASGNELNTGVRCVKDASASP